MVFARRLEKAGLVEVERVLGIEHPAREALVEADARVEARVAELDREMFAPVTQADCVELGRKVVDGRLKPKTVAERVSSAATKLNPDGSSRRSFVLQGVRAQLVADEDRPEWSVRGLREGFADAAQRAVDEHVQAVVEALAATPEGMRERLLSTLGSGVDFSLISAEELDQDEFAAYRRLRDLAMSETGGGNVDLLPSLVLVADAFAGRDYRQRHDSFDRLKPGVEPDFIEDLLWTGDAELIGAGYTLDAIVKARVKAELDPIVDPAGRDKEAYEDRVARYQRVRSWRFELGNLRAMKTPIPGAVQRELKRRVEMSPDQVLAAMREEGVLDD